MYRSAQLMAAGGNGLRLLRNELSGRRSSATLAKARSRHQREPAPDQRREQARLHYHERHRLARQNPLLYQQLYTPSTRPQPRPEQPQPAAATEPHPRSPRQESGRVPLFPDTREGQQQRLAYYEARKLDHLPDSLYDYHDVKNGRETPAERPPANDTPSRHDHLDAPTGTPPPSTKPAPPAPLMLSERRRTRIDPQTVAFWRKSDTFPLLFRPCWARELRGPFERTVPGTELTFQLGLLPASHRGLTRLKNPCP